MIVLIDGHNLIGRMPDIQLSDPDDEAKLLARLRVYQVRTGHQLEVFFDPGLSYRSPDRQSLPGLTVYWLAPGQQADSMITRRMLQHPNSRELLVVTADRALQKVAREQGAQVIDSGQFVRELQAPPRRRNRRPRRQVVCEPPLSEDETKYWMAVFRRSSKR